nr:hypothetical protein [Tanacetum cinerariifolium]
VGQQALETFKACILEMMPVAKLPPSSRELGWRATCGWRPTDKRPAWVKEEERKFIEAANSLKTLQVTPEGGMRIDPEEIRDQIIAGRELYKQFVKRFSDAFWRKINMEVPGMPRA